MNITPMPNPMSVYPMSVYPMPITPMPITPMPITPMSVYRMSNLMPNAMPNLMPNPQCLKFHPNPNSYSNATRTLTLVTSDRTAMTSVPAKASAFCALSSAAAASF